MCSYTGDKEQTRFWLSQYISHPCKQAGFLIVDMAAIALENGSKQRDSERESERERGFETLRCAENLRPTSADCVECLKRNAIPKFDRPTDYTACVFFFQLYRLYKIYSTPAINLMMDIEHRLCPKPPYQRCCD
jgi:hypothetical protein